MHTLILGSASDEDILVFKGPTILNGAERAEILRAVKWGDEVIADVPYEPTEEVLN